jgi:cysteinyl-tRNA synthetase
MYEDNFKMYSEALSFTPPRAYTRATEYMEAQIAMVQVLTEK